MRMIAALMIAMLPAMSSAQDAPISETTPEALVEALAPPPVFRGIKVTPAVPPSVNLAVEFAYDSAELSENAKALLSDLAVALADDRLSDYRFLVAGHTDAVGSEAYNQSLSEARARSVQAFLYEEYGILPTRLEVEGLGESELLFPEAPEDGRNRRVQISTLE